MSNLCVIQNFEKNLDFNQDLAAKLQDALDEGGFSPVDFPDEGLYLSADNAPLTVVDREGSRALSFERTGEVYEYSFYSKSQACPNSWQGEVHVQDRRLLAFLDWEQIQGLSKTVCETPGALVTDLRQPKNYLRKTVEVQGPTESGILYYFKQLHLDSSKARPNPAMFAATVEYQHGILYYLQQLSPQAVLQEGIRPHKDFRIPANRNAAVEESFSRISGVRNFSDVSPEDKNLSAAYLYEGAALVYRRVNPKVTLYDTSSDKIRAYYTKVLKPKMASSDVCGRSLFSQKDIEMAMGNRETRAFSQSATALASLKAQGVSDPVVVLAYGAGHYFNDDAAAHPSPLTLISLEFPNLIFLVTVAPYIASLPSTIFPKSLKEDFAFFGIVQRDQGAYGVNMTGLPK